jgi:hypothetical protein
MKRPATIALLDLYDDQTVIFVGLGPAVYKNALNLIFASGRLCVTNCDFLDQDYPVTLMLGTMKRVAPSFG